MLWLKENPHTYRMRASRQDYEAGALRQGHLAVNSILRDWIKAQVTAIECGVLSFEMVFMAHTLGTDGRPLIERAADLLPRPDPPKVVTVAAEMTRARSKHVPGAKPFRSRSNTLAGNRA